MVMTYVGGNVITQPQLDRNGNPKASVDGDGLENTDTAFIRASGKSDGTGGVFFEGTVNFGATFVIDSINVSGRTELHSDTLVEIYTEDMNELKQTIIFHTSCSKLLRLNDQFGGVVVSGWTDKNGNVVGIQPPPPPAVVLDEVGFVAGSAELKHGDKHLVLDLENASAVGVARIAEIVITWPAGNGKLKKIKLAGKTIFDTDIPYSGLPESITVFEGSVSYRSFGPGSVVELKFEFDKGDAVGLGDYVLEIDFGAGLEPVVIN